MNEMIHFLKEIGIDLAILISGLAGGLISLNKSDELSNWEKLLTVVSGGVIATYITPLFITLFSSVLKNNDNIEYGIGFVIGFLGLKSLEMIISKLKNNDTKD